MRHITKRSAPESAPIDYELEYALDDNSELFRFPANAAPRIRRPMWWEE